MWSKYINTLFFNVKQAYNQNTAIQTFTLLIEIIQNFFFTNSALNKLSFQYYSTLNSANRVHGQKKLLSTCNLAKFFNMGMKWSYDNIQIQLCIFSLQCCLRNYIPGNVKVNKKQCIYLHRIFKLQGVQPRGKRVLYRRSGGTFLCNHHALPTSGSAVVR